MDFFGKWNFMNLSVFLCVCIVRILTFRWQKRIPIMIFIKYIICFFFLVIAVSYGRLFENVRWWLFFVSFYYLYNVVRLFVCMAYAYMPTMGGSEEFYFRLYVFNIPFFNFICFSFSSFKVIYFLKWLS